MTFTNPNSVRKKSALKLGASLSLLALAIPSLAQAQSDGLQLEEIVVTATRRAASLQDVPLAVSAFTAADLETRQISSTLDLVRSVPNLYGSNNTGVASANTYYIRGLGSTEQIATIDPAVSTYVDDVVLPRQNANNYGYFDLEQMEVLRGPQGTTFGRNSTGGAISVKLKKPSEEFGGFMQASYGSYDQILLRGDVNVPVSEKVLTKFTGFYTDDRGYVTNVANGERLNSLTNWGARGAVRFLPNDDVTVDVALEHMDGQGLYLRTFARDNRETILRGSTKGGTSDEVADALANRGVRADYDTTAVTANIEWRLDDVSIESITGYRTINQSFVLDFSLPASRTTVPLPFYLTNAGGYDMFSQEFKAAGNFGDRLSYVAGLYYFYENNSTLAGQVFGTSLSCSAGLYGDGNMTCNGVPGYSSVRDIRNKTTSYAAYAQFDYALTDALTAIAGVRYTNEVKKLDLRPTSYGGMTTADIVAAGMATRLETNKVTPKFGVNYKVDPDIMLFASATNGYKSGGWNSRTAYLPETFQDMSPETAWSYEAGMKSDLFDRRVRFNVTGFIAETDNLQLSYTTPGPIPGTTLSTQDNAGDIRVKGLEFELSVRPARGLDVFATLGLQDGKYTWVNPAAQSFVSPTGAYVNAIDPTDELSRLPKRSLALGATYTVPVEALHGSLTFSGEANHTGGFWTTASNSTPSAQTPTALDTFARSYTLYNLSVSYLSDDEAWRLGVECKNCSDKLYLTSVFNGYYYGEPRRIRGTLTRKF
ncbi:TonB-dependent receptor [Niveispirillum fermenti]